MSFALGKTNPTRVLTMQSVKQNRTNNSCCATSSFEICQSAFWTRIVSLWRVLRATNGYTKRRKRIVRPRLQIFSWKSGRYVQFRCSTVSSGQVVRSVIHGLLRCSCTRSSASLDQTITRTDAYIHGCMRACCFAVDHARNAYGPMYAGGRRLCFLCEVRYTADFARRYFTERAVITRSVYLEFPELLFPVNCAAVDCFWRDSYDAVKTVCSYRYETLSCLRDAKTQRGKLRCPIMAHYQRRWLDRQRRSNNIRCLTITTFHCGNFSVSRLITLKIVLEIINNNDILTRSTKKLYASNIIQFCVLIKKYIFVYYWFKPIYYMIRFM